MKTNKFKMLALIFGVSALLLLSAPSYADLRGDAPVPAVYSQTYEKPGVGLLTDRHVVNGVEPVFARHYRRLGPAFHRRPFVRPYYRPYGPHYRTFVRPYPLAPYGRVGPWPPNRPYGPYAWGYPPFFVPGFSFYFRF